MAYTTFRNHSSTKRQFKSGVQQGGVLSPILFNIYTSDIPLPPDSVQLTTYADDITITAPHTDIKQLGRSIANYVAPVWSTNASDTSLGKIQRTQNEALNIITGSHKMSSIDHLHSETKMLPVEDHLNLISAQYLVHCLDTENGCHHITTLDHPPREMNDTFH